MNLIAKLLDEHGSEVISTMILALFGFGTIGLKMISQRLAKVQAEQKPNGGSSMRDTIEKIRLDVSAISTQLSQIDAQVRGRLELENGGYFMTDSKGHCIWTSAVWTELTGISAPEARGDGWIRGIHERDRQGVWNAWDLAVASGVNFNMKYLTARGNLVQGKAVELKAQDGKVVGVLGVITPVGIE